MKSVVLSEMIQPETDLEAFLLRQPELVSGMGWGTPRFGHPEGEVWRHVVEVLANIDKLVDVSAPQRRDLRLVALVHDSFKYAEIKSEPRDWSQHHGILARRFAERFTSVRRVIELTEWHDEAYYCWRLEALYHRRNRSQQRLDRLLDRFSGEVDFYYRFFVCDTRTGDKNLAPLRWFEREADIDVPTW